MKLKLDKLSADQKAQAINLMKQVGDADPGKSLAAQQAFAAQVQVPLRQGIVDGDILADIFNMVDWTEGGQGDYPVDLFRPDNDGEFAAFTIPNQGRIPERHVEGDYVRVPTYDIGGGIDFLLRYAKEARFDVVGRALEVLEAGFKQKLNRDGWHTLLAAGVYRNILVSDSNADAGQFTPALVSAMKVAVRRNAGGNSASANRGRLTNLFVSPEAVEDMRAWGLDKVDDVTRREIWVAADGSLNKVFGVMVGDLDELGEGQEFQTYYTSTLSASMADSDVEIVVGLDLQDNSTFVMPVREQLEIYPDPNLHRQRRAGFYGWMSAGFGVLDGRKIILGSI